MRGTPQGIDLCLFQPKNACDFVKWDCSESATGRALASLGLRHAPPLTHFPPIPFDFVSAFLAEISYRSHPFVIPLMIKRVPYHLRDLYKTRDRLRLMVDMRKRQVLDTVLGLPHDEKPVTLAGADRLLFELKRELRELDHLIRTVEQDLGIKK